MSWEGYNSTRFRSKIRALNIILPLTVGMGSQGEPAGTVYKQSHHLKDIFSLGFWTVKPFYHKKRIIINQSSLKTIHIKPLLWWGEKHTFLVSVSFLRCLNLFKAGTQLLKIRCWSVGFLNTDNVVYGFLNELLCVREFVFCRK